MEQIAIACSKKGTALFNLSDGIYLEGWEPCTPSSNNFHLPQPKNKKALENWWNKQSIFSKDALS